MTGPRKGWGWLTTMGGHRTHRLHYFVNGRSLCMRWQAFNPPGFVDVQDNAKGNCALCQRRLAAQKEAA